MPQISFYSLSDPAPESRLQLACRLSEKVFSLGRRLFLLTDSAEEAEALGRQLWSYRPSSFVPHTLNEMEEPQRERVAIGTARQLEFHGDVLINLSSEPVHAHQRFQRINEVVCADADITRQLREHYRFYQQAGYEIETTRL